MSRSVSAPSLVTNTSPCWKGFIVPGSTFRYGSSFCITTRRPRALSSMPRLEAVRPLPSEEATPPVTKMCLVVVDFGGRHGQEGAPVVAVCECGAARRARRSRCSCGGAVAAVRGFCGPTGPRATRVSAPGASRLPATLRTRRGTQPCAASSRFLTRCSPVRPTRVARSGTQIIYVRRILLGHSLPSPAGDTAPPLARSTGTTRARQFVEQCRSPFCLTAERAALLHRSTTHDNTDPLTALSDRPLAGVTWPFDWSCTWPGASKTTHSSETCRPPPWSAGTARSTGCACPASTRMPSSPACSAPRNTASGGSARRTRPDAAPPDARPGARYRGDSLILESEWDTPRGTVRVTDFMPPRDGAPQLIRIVEGISGPGADALGAADAVLATAGSCRGCTSTTAARSPSPVPTRCGSTPTPRPTART